MAVVLVGRIVDIRHESWQSMPAALKAAVRQGLWHNFTHETDPELVRKLSHAVARASEGWKDLVAASIGLLGSTNDQARQVGVFFLLEQMSEYSDELKSDPGRLLPVFQAALVDDMTLSVRCGALKALLSLLNHIETRAAVINGGPRPSPLCRQCH
ncbi:importin-like protein [Nannochloropsis oceanica]